MGIDKLWKKSRADRLVDPAIQRDLDDEWDRVKKSLGNLGDQTKETCSAVLYNTFVRPFIPTASDKKRKLGASERIVHGSVDSTAKTGALIGRILLSTGRITKYGVRRTLVI